MKRTTQQNKAGWLACEMLANEFLERGLDKRIVLSKAKFDLPWTKESVHEDIYNEISRALFGTTSSGLDSSQPSIVWGYVEGFTNTHWGFAVPWPDEQTMMLHKKITDAARARCSE